MKYCIAFISFFLFSCYSFGGGFTITKNKEYAIYIRQDSPKLMRYAANELARYLAETTGAICEVKAEKQCAVNQLTVGTEKPVKAVFLPNTLKESADDEFIIRVDDNSLTIDGGNARGVLYGVYTFLEDFLQCRWYSSKVRIIPFSGTTRIKT